MTISSEVTYGAGQPELYRELSAAEDRATTDTGSDAMPAEAPPSFEISREGAEGGDGGDWLTSILAFDKDMLGFDEALRSSSEDARYLTMIGGLPWPPPWVPPQYNDTVPLQGLSGACRCGLQGLGGCGCRFAGFEGTDDDLDFDLHTTASFSREGRRLSGLSGFAAADGPDSEAKRMQGMQQVLRAAALPTTQSNRVVTRRLLDQSSALADKMAKYADVAERAARFRGVSLKRTGVADAATQALVERIFDPRTGEPREDANPADLAKLRKLRRDAFEAGREAVRAEKVLVLAKNQAANTYAQAGVLQKMAAATVGGQPEAAAVYVQMFDKLGQEGAAMRALRQNQKARWLQKEVSELNGLDDLGAIDSRILGADYWEADLDGLEIVEDAYLGELEGWLRRKLRKAGRKIKRGVKKAGRGIKRGVKGAARGVASATKSAARAAGRAAQRATQATIRGATNAARKAARAAVRGAKSIKNSTFAKNFVNVMKPIGRGLKAAARVAIAPAKMSFKITGNLARGNFRGALRSVKSAAKETVSGIANVGRNLVFGVGCAMENTRLGRAAGQAVGQAVGTFYGGGQAGGAVGREAGRKANDINRGLCKGIKQLGLTGDSRLSFSAKNLKRSLKASARDLKRTTFSKQAMLASALRIAQTAATGGGASMPGMSTLTNYGTKQFAKIGLDALKNKGKDLLKKKGQQLLTQGASKLVGGKAGRLIGAAAGAYASGGRVRLPSAQEAMALARQQLTPQGAMALARRAGVPTSQAQLVAMARQQAWQQAQKQARRVGVPTSQAQLIARIRQRAGIPSNVPTSRAQVTALARQQAIARLTAARRQTAAAPNLFAQQVWG